MGLSPVHSGTRFRIEQVTLDHLDDIKYLNEEIFNESRVINRYDRPDLIMLLAFSDKRPIGFKVGYGESVGTFYSAKGGTLPAFRRNGVASQMLETMILLAARKGYNRFAFDSIPCRYPEMSALALKHGFEVVSARYDAHFKAIRVRFERLISQKSA